MIRSNRSIRRLGALFVAVLISALLVPAGAFAQGLSPTDEQYNQGVVGVASSDGGSSGSISELPFTGLDVAAIALIGIGLVGAGFVIRRASREGDNSVS
ncbi:MAG: hypothetical protein U0R51_10895 [Solirubrobacterales bacterium]